MYIHVNGARLYFDVEGSGLVPDGAVMREKAEGHLMPFERLFWEEADSGSI